MSLFFGNQKGNDTFAIRTNNNRSLKLENLIFSFI
jgi:hypothetical protein